VEVASERVGLVRTKIAFCCGCVSRCVFRGVVCRPLLATLTALTALTALDFIDRTGAGTGAGTGNTAPPITRIPGQHHRTHHVEDGLEGQQRRDGQRGFRGHHTQLLILRLVAQVHELGHYILHERLFPQRPPQLLHAPQHLGTLRWPRPRRQAQ
jgi:hypothetical protein